MMNTVNDTISEKGSKVEKALRDIFVRRTGVDFDKYINCRDFKLLGINVGVKSYDLLNVYFDIEKVFAIKIPSSTIEKGNFDTYNNILELVNRELGGENA